MGRCFLNDLFWDWLNNEQFVLSLCFSILIQNFTYKWICVLFMDMVWSFILSVTFHLYLKIIQQGWKNHNFVIRIAFHIIKCLENQFKKWIKAIKVPHENLPDWPEFWQKRPKIFYSYSQWPEFWQNSENKFHKGSQHNVNQYFAIYIFFGCKGQVTLM